MKYSYLLLLNSILLFGNSLIAQDVGHGNEAKGYNLGNFKGYIENLRTKAFDGVTSIKVDESTEYQVHIYTSTNNELIGKLDEDETVLSLYTDEEGTRGFFIVSASENVVYEYKTDKDGLLKVYPADINEVICHNYHTDSNQLPKREDSDKHKVVAHTTNALELESYPGSENIIMVDMDGYNLPAGTDWNNGRAYTAEPVGWDDEKLILVWAEIAEDLAPFDVNVTTKEALWAAADKKKRQRVIITRSKAFTSGDGVAHFSWGNGKNDDPCWMWMTDKYTTDEVGDVASHELGHTLHCQHQGGPNGPYFPGNDDPSHDGWVPIMGNAFKKIISQWCKSEFDGATANQDDLAKIAGNIPYKEDDHGDDSGNATTIVMDQSTGNVEAEKNPGLITTRTDVDYFKFMAGAGKLNLTIKPTALNRTNLDMIAKLYDIDNQLIATADLKKGPIATEEAGHKNLLEGVTFNLDLTAGMYYLEIDGYGTGNPSTGYTDYGSLGPYALSGNIPVSTVGVNETAVTNELLVYPSPSNGFIMVEGKGEAYELINSLGKVVKKGQMNTAKKEKISLYNLQNGFYIFKVRAQDKYITRSIILNKN